MSIYWYKLQLDLSYLLSNSQLLNSFITSDIHTPVNNLSNISETISLFNVLNYINGNSIKFP